MRNDRVQVAPGQLGAKLRANAYATFTADRLRAARPVLVVAGRYDRAAIMREACRKPGRSPQERREPPRLQASLTF